MNDPFFDEDDDGDFDDLYSTAPRREQAPVATDLQPTKARAPEHAVTDGWGGVDGAAYSYSVSPASSVPSTTTSRSGAGANANQQQPQQRQTHSTDSKRQQQASAAANARRYNSADAMRPPKATRRKGSEELFNVDWEDDDTVTACFQCDSSFSLLKRKHHCRHCGGVMCSDCSVFRYFDVSRKKHRVCTACNTVLARANRLPDSDVESLERSGATADAGHGPGTSATRASGAAGKAKKPRGKLRENLKKTFASRDAKKQKAKTEAPTSSAARSDAPVHARAADRATESTRAADARGRHLSDDLFDVADDTWFTDPQDGERTSKSSRSLGRDSDDHVGTARHTIATAAPPSSAASWQSRGPQPQSQQPTALSIDVYASRETDVLVQQRPARMEMPRPVAHVMPIASTLSSREPTAQLRASTYDGDAAFASRPSARVTGTAQPTVFTAVRPTFYDAHADELVVDDAPGYYARATTSGASSMDERRATMTDSALYGTALMPATVPPRAIVTDSDSYSLVEAPGDSGGSHEASGTPAAAAAGAEKPQSEPPHDPNARGFTGALKRLFGISGAKPPGTASSQSQTQTHEPPRGAALASVPGHGATSPPLAIERMASDPRRVSSAANVLSSQSTDRDFASSSGVPRVGSFDRYSMAERSFVSSRAAGERYSIAESTNTTVAVNAAASTVLSSTRGFRHDDAAPSHVATISDTFASREASTRPRRDTFDELFASPTSQAIGTSGTGALPTRAWTGVHSTLAMPPTGVDRFDRQQRDDESDNNGVDRTPALNGLTPGVYSITRSRSSSIGLGESALGASRVTTTATVNPTQAPPTSWRSVTPEASYGVATYAVPSSIGTDRFATSSQVRHDGSQDGVASSEASTSIMDDLHRRTGGSAARSSERTSSVDDIFAAFERPNEYVFDAATGGYVATATTPARSHNRVAPQSSQSHEQSSAQVREARSERRDDRVERRNDGASVQRRETSERAMARGDDHVDDDALDDTIVDKISSLEDELAALKRLIRQRKDHEPSSANAPRRRPTESASSTRKLSIFDHDSSSDAAEEDRAGRRTSSRRATRRKATSSAAAASAEADVASPQTQRRPKTKAKTPQKRRDSFADLFEDSPTQDAAALGGGGGYESLFQTGAGKAKDTSGSSSDEHQSPHRQRLDNATKRTSARASRKTRGSASSASDDATRSYLTPGSVVATAQDVEEEEFPSLKYRKRGSAATRSTTATPPSRTKTTASAGIFSDSDDDDDDSAAVSIAVPSVRASVKSRATTTVPASSSRAAKSKRPDVDAIDALFDDASDRDVARFFDDGEQASGGQEPLSPLVQSPASDPTVAVVDASDAESSDAVQSTATTASARATPRTEAQATDAHNSDEEFARSLATAKKLRSKTESLPVATAGTAPSSAIAASSATPAAADLFAATADLTARDSTVDSDDDVVSLLAVHRTTDTTPAPQALELDVTVALAPEAALVSVASSNTDTGATEARGVQDDVPTQPKAGNAARGKSVSFFDQQSDRAIAASANQSNGAAEDSDAEDEEKTRPTEAVAGVETASNVGSDAPAPAPAPAVVPASLESEVALADEFTRRATDADLDSSLQLQGSATAPSVPAKTVGATPAARLHTNDDDDDDVMAGLFTPSSDLYSSALESSSLPSVATALNKRHSDSEDDDSDTGGHSNDDEPAFSFEVKRKPKRTTPPALSFLDLAVPARRAPTAADDDDSAVLMLGKYASAPSGASPLHPAGGVADAPDSRSSPEATTALSASVESLESLAPSSAAASVALPCTDPTADVDWQLLQEQEKARRKKLQLKQRQAQREKLLLKKQGGSSRHVVGGSADASATAGEKKAKTKKSSKSKAQRSPDGATDDDARRKKASRKHKHASEPSNETVEDARSSSTRTEL